MNVYEGMMEEGACFLVKKRSNKACNVTKDEVLDFEYFAKILNYFFWYFKL